MSILGDSYAVHGAPYLPWSNFFWKCSQCETLVILDDTKMTNGRSYTNRAKVSIAGETKYISVPIRRKSIGTLLRNEVNISTSEDWRQNHIETLRHAYGKREYWSDVSLILKNRFRENHDKLIDLNLSLISDYFEYVGFKCSIVRSSTLGIPFGDASNRIAEIGAAIKKNVYISGPGGKNYIMENDFSKRNMHIVYKKPHNNAPRVCLSTPGIWIDTGLSVVDRLTVLGEESFNEN